MRERRTEDENTAKRKLNENGITRNRTVRMEKQEMKIDVDVEKKTREIIKFSKSAESKIQRNCASMENVVNSINNNFTVPSTSLSIVGTWRREYVNFLFLLDIAQLVSVLGVKKIQVKKTSNSGVDLVPVLKPTQN
ncbi:hypothetical protein RUM43_001565 [Polyplax serrata]|uniref:Uncharacterized protein n=1 Tax=Polyplax serrata TaxID=468196 RepID=A0AAN8SFM1_POLSC